MILLSKMSLLVNYYFVALAVGVILTVVGAVRYGPDVCRDWRTHARERMEGRSPDSHHNESKAIKNWKMGG